MGRVLGVLLLLCGLLPCYVWYAELHAVAVFPAGHRPYLPPPFLLLNDTASPPFEELSGLGADDGVRLMDLDGFDWLLGGDVRLCAPLVLVLVHSATDHVEHRQLIRETWGSWGGPDDILVRFLVGQPAEDSDHRKQRALLEEAETYGDLVQGSFVDAYRNMTYKHAMALKWFVTRCPQATYVLKVDDDVFVNTPVLLDFVRRSLSPFGARRLLSCSVLTGAMPKRTWRSKWRVSWREYAPMLYPTYCAGWAVLYSPDVAMRLYAEVQRVRYFWIDDVLITGVIPDRLGLKHVSWESFLMTPSELPHLLDGQQRPTFMLALWYTVSMEMEDQRVIWRRILDDVSTKVSTTSTNNNIATADRERLTVVSL